MQNQIEKEIIGKKTSRDRECSCVEIEKKNKIDVIC